MDLDVALWVVGIQVPVLILDLDRRLAVWFAMSYSKPGVQVDQALADGQRKHAGDVLKSEGGRGKVVRQR